MGPRSSKGRIIGHGNLVEANAILKKAGNAIAVSQRMVFHLSRCFFSVVFMCLVFLVVVGSVYWRCARTPNDPKLSDGRGWRDGCWVRRRGEVERGKDGGRTRRVEPQIAASVTAAPVRCSAWLGVDVRFGVGPEVCGTARIRSQRRVARKPKLVAEQAVE